MKRGLFVSFEGVDGSGKTTQLERLAARLRDAGVEPVVAQEPGGTRIGLEIRRLLLDAASSDLDSRAELLLYFASRAQNIAEVIAPALAAGRVVLADRFTDATVAYQGYGRELGAAAVRAVEQVACQGLRPDVTLWLDLDPEESVRRALARRASGPDETRMEREGKLFRRRVAEGYETLARAEPERIRRVPAGGSPDEVERAVTAAVRPLLAERLNVQIA